MATQFAELKEELSAARTVALTIAREIKPLMGRIDELETELQGLYEEQEQQAVRLEAAEAEKTELQGLYEAQATRIEELKTARELDTLKAGDISGRTKVLVWQERRKSIRDQDGPRQGGSA